MNNFKIGIQLYSLRDEMAQDFEGTLKAVAEMGYQCVEFAGYYDHSAEEIKAICDKYNLEIASAHHGLDFYENETESVISTLKTFGAKYCAIACISPEDWQSQYDNLVERITKTGKKLQENGIQLIYHNHEYEMQYQKNGMPLLDAMYSDIPAESLAPQLDVCWVHYGGKKPVEYINKYADALKVLHIKDFECENLDKGYIYELNPAREIPEQWIWNRMQRENEGFKYRPIGYGRQNFPEILKTVEETDIEYVIVEQDLHYDTSGLEDAKLSIEYLHSIGY